LKGWHDAGLFMKIAVDDRRPTRESLKVVAQTQHNVAKIQKEHFTVRAERAIGR
jgi:hypothetical protein